MPNCLTSSCRVTWSFETIGERILSAHNLVHACFIITKKPDVCSQPKMYQEGSTLGYEENYEEEEKFHHYCRPFVPQRIGLY